MNDVINEICLYTFGWEQFPHFQAFLHNLSISWCEHEWYGKTTLCYYDFIKRSRAALFPFTFFDPVSFQTRSANFPLIICSIEFVIENFEHILFSVDKIQLKIIQMRRQSTEKVWFWEFVSNRPIMRCFDGGWKGYCWLSAQTRSCLIGSMFIVVFCKFTKQMPKINFHIEQFRNEWKKIMKTDYTRWKVKAQNKKKREKWRDNWTSKWKCFSFFSNACSRYDEIGTRW